MALLERGEELPSRVPLSKVVQLLGELAMSEKPRDRLAAYRRLACAGLEALLTDREVEERAALERELGDG